MNQRKKWKNNGKNKWIREKNGKIMEKINKSEKKNGKIMEKKNESEKKNGKIMKK